MSFAIDANILLYASNTASPHYESCRTFLAEAAAGPEILYLAWPTAMAYLRISTHPRVFSAPLSHTEALGNLRNLLSRPNVRILSEERDFIDLYGEVSGEVTIRGNLVPDAHLATLLLQHGVRTLYTHDADFLRFGFLDVRNPLEA